MSELTGVILGAGEGERLQRGGAPKALAEFHDGPLVARQVRYLRSHDVNPVVVTLLDRWANEGIDLAREHGFHVSFEKQTHGTAGSLARACRSDQPVAVLLGDVVTDLNVGDVTDALRTAHAVIAVYEGDQRGNGAVFIDKARRVQEFREKSHLAGHGLVCAGVYAFRPAVLRLCEGRYVDLGRDVIPEALRIGLTVRAVETDRPVIGIDNAERLKKARRLARTKGFGW